MLMNPYGRGRASGAFEALKKVSAGLAAVAGDVEELQNTGVDTTARADIATLSTQLDAIENLGKWPHKKSIALTGTGSAETDYILKLNVHRGMPVGDAKGTDIFLNGGCKTDFSDVRFYDAEGNNLDYYLQSHGNYEIVYDNRLKIRNIVRDGVIWGNSSRALEKSIDNGQTWEVVLSSSGIVELVYIDSRGNIFVTKDLYKLYRSADDGETWSEVLDMTSSSGYIKWRNMVEDSSGNLYAGRYQESLAPVIYKSVDEGATWSESYVGTPNTQHVHGLAVDPYTGYIYAGLDGVSKTDKKTLRTTDNGATWVEIWTGHAADVNSILFPQPGLRIFAGGNGVQRCSVHKTTDDVTFTPLLPTNAVVQELCVLDGHIYAFAVSNGLNCYPQIYRMNLDGSNAKTIWIAPFENSQGFTGPQYTSIGLPNASLERHVIVGPKSAGVEYDKLRLYAGGQHYQATFHIKIPNLPAAGTEIIVLYGNSVASSESNIGIYPSQGIVYSNPLIRLPINDGSGTVAGDLSGNSRNGAITTGTGGWSTGSNGVRAGGSYPWIEPGMTSYLFDNSDYVTIPTDAALEGLTKNFSVLAWIKTSSSTIPQTIISKGASNTGFALQIRSTNYWTLGITYGNGTTAKTRSHPSADNLNNGEWHLVGVIFTNDTPVKVIFVADGTVYAAQSLDFDPLFANNQDIRIGSNSANGEKFVGNISNVVLYPYQLTALQVQQIYENRFLAVPDPMVLTTLV